MTTHDGTGSWPETMGNHRAALKVGAAAEAVRARVLWRRRDAHPDAKAIGLVRRPASALEGLGRIRHWTGANDWLLGPGLSGHDRPERRAVTAYVRDGGTPSCLLSIASWAPDTVSCPLRIDWAALGLSPDKAMLHAPGIPDFQSECRWRATEPVPVAPGRGWLIRVNEKD